MEMYGHKAVAIVLMLCISYVIIEHTSFCSILIKKKFVWKKLLVLGDSNTQFGFSKNGNWLGELSNRFQRSCDVVNRGFGGYNTRYLRLILPELLSEFTADELAGIIILLGTNDSAKNQLQHVSIEDYENNYQWILDYLYGFGIDKERIIVITPPKIADEMRQGSEHFDDLVKNYADACKQIAMRNQLTYLDLYTIMNVNIQKSNLKDYLYDGLHLTPSCVSLLIENLWPIIDTKFLKTKIIRQNYPEYNKIRYRENLQSLPQFEL